MAVMHVGHSTLAWLSPVSLPLLACERVRETSEDSERTREDCALEARLEPGPWNRSGHESGQVWAAL